MYGSVFNVYINLFQYCVRLVICKISIYWMQGIELSKDVSQSLLTNITRRKPGLVSLSLAHSCQLCFRAPPPRQRTPWLVTRLHLPVSGIWQRVRSFSVKSTFSVAEVTTATLGSFVERLKRAQPRGGLRH